MNSLNILFQKRITIFFLPIIANLFFFLLIVYSVKGQEETIISLPEVEFVEEEDISLYVQLTDFLINFQRRVNTEVATHMKAIEKGEDLGAFFFGLAIAFAYGVVHAFGPGHGKFIIISYFVK